MAETILYGDRFIEILPDSIRLFGFLTGRKHIPFSRISCVKALEPTIWNGKYRMVGSGDFRTWFPMDDRRTERDTIFILSFKNRWIRLGFTVEDSAQVKTILGEKLHLIDTAPTTPADSVHKNIAAEINFPNEGKGFGRSFWIILGAIFLLYPILGLAFYPSLPDKMACHWSSFTTEPDVFMSKTHYLILMTVFPLGVSFMMALPGFILSRLSKIMGKLFRFSLISLNLFLLGIHLLVLLWNVGYKTRIGVWCLAGGAVLIVATLVKLWAVFGKRRKAQENVIT